MPALPIKVLPGLTIDLSYRYTDLGDARAGRVITYNNQFTGKGLKIEDIAYNDVMLSVRGALGSQPAPMPVAFKSPLTI
jgi:opacity protein-like surface antigen